MSGVPLCFAIPRYSCRGSSAKNASHFAIQCATNGDCAAVPFGTGAPISRLRTTESVPLTTSSDDLNVASMLGNVLPDLIQRKQSLGFAYHRS